MTTTVVNIKDSGLHVWQYDKWPDPYVYVGRPSKWGNPFALGWQGDRDEVVENYRAWLAEQPELLAAIPTELYNKVLVCFCAPLRCHGDILAELANIE